MTRYWVSWWTGNYVDEGCTEPPFKHWITGQRGRANNGLNAEQLKLVAQIHDEDEYDKFLDTYSRDDCSICATIDAESEYAVWELVSKYFPDYEPRFCEEKPADFDPVFPGSRFQ